MSIEVCGLASGSSGNCTLLRTPAGAMLLDAEDVTRVLARSETPLLAPETDDERTGTVSNVVFPTATEMVDGVRYVFYGMADARIGVAALERIQP